MDTMPKVFLTFNIVKYNVVEKINGKLVVSVICIAHHSYKNALLQKQMYYIAVLITKHFIKYFF